MILFSVGAGGYAEGGELDPMMVQVDPLNGFQGRVTEQPLQMVPHERGLSLFHSEGERGV